MAMDIVEGYVIDTSKPWCAAYARFVYNIVGRSTLYSFPLNHYNIDLNFQFATWESLEITFMYVSSIYVSNVIFIELVIVTVYAIINTISRSEPNFTKQLREKQASLVERVRNYLFS